MNIIRVLIGVIMLFCSMTAQAKIPSVQQITSPNGLNAWVINDKFLPIISLKISFKNSGSAFDPAGIEGLAMLVSSTLDEGVGEMDSQAYNKKLEELATSISFNQTNDRFSISITCLTENLRPSLEILKNILNHPRFDDDAVERVKGQIFSIIKSKEKDPEYLASQALARSIFGNHPYSRAPYGTIKSIQDISKNDLINFVRNRFTKQNISISISGDYADHNIANLLDEYIILPETAINPPLFDPIILNGGGILHVQAPSPQSVIKFGLKGVKRNDENFYPLYIMNHILGGGGFESRLMSEIREKNGLVYGIYSYLDTYEKTGLLVGSASTENINVPQATSLIRAELKKMREQGITKGELEITKNYMINSFPLKMTKNSNLASFLDVMQHDNLGIDFLQKRNSYIKNVTLKQINNLSAKYLNEKNLHIVVSGDVSTTE